MTRNLVLGAVIALGLLGTPRAQPEQDIVRLKEERMSIEYTATAEEAALVVSAEAEEGLTRIEIRDPSGGTFLRLNGGPVNQELGVFGFVVEAGESPYATLFETYPEGDYQIRARTSDGRLALGSAQLRHRLPQTPIVVYPLEGTADVPSHGLEITWIADTTAVEYRLNLEQGETDLLSVRLPGGSTSFRVPDGVLESGRRSQLEIGAVGADGNCTIVEVPFLTQ